MPEQPVKLIECPRDAMQGWKTFIPATQKVEYLNTLLQVGFDTLDCGSFVSPKAIPQMADTGEVLDKLDMDATSTKLLVIVANERGATEAVQYDQVSYLGFPFSVSPTFQQRNTNSTPQESLARVEAIQHLCIRHNKQLVVYLSMGFGNPYGDPYNEEIVSQWVEALLKNDIRILSLADTVGLATAEQVYTMTRHLITSLPDIEIGVHLHSAPDNWRSKMEAALRAGCIRFDGALKGVGGCPMANDELVGNMDTEKMIGWLTQQNRLPALNQAALTESLIMANRIFN